MFFLWKNYTSSKSYSLPNSHWWKLYNIGLARGKLFLNHCGPMWGLIGNLYQKLFFFKWKKYKQNSEPHRFSQSYRGIISNFTISDISHLGMTSFVEYCICGILFFHYSHKVFFFFISLSYIVFQRCLFNVMVAHYSHKPLLHITRLYFDSARALTWAQYIL